MNILPSLSSRITIIGQELICLDQIPLILDARLLLISSLRFKHYVMKLIFVANSCCISFSAS